MGSLSEVASPGPAAPHLPWGVTMVTKWYKQAVSVSTVFRYVLAGLNLDRNPFILRVLKIDQKLMEFIYQTLIVLSIILEATETCLLNLLSAGYVKAMTELHKFIFQGE